MYNIICYVNNVKYTLSSASSVFYLTKDYNNNTRKSNYDSPFGGEMSNRIILYLKNQKYHYYNENYTPLKTKIKTKIKTHKFKSKIQRQIPCYVSQDLKQDIDNTQEVEINDT